jgi:hypothetical protein
MAKSIKRSCREKSFSRKEMNALAIRPVVNYNLKISDEFEGADFIDYQTPDYSKWFEATISYINANSIAFGWKAGGLIDPMFLSQRLKGVVAAPPENFYIYFYSKGILKNEKLNYPRPSDRFIFTPVDSRLNYVANEQETESADKAEMEAEFHVLAKQWEDETSFHSSLAMGRDALPWIFSELQRKPRHWFYALEKIVGYDVAADAKNFAEARAAWLEWGNNNDYI